MEGHPRGTLSKMRPGHTVGVPVVVGREGHDGVELQHRPVEHRASWTPAWHSCLGDQASQPGGWGVGGEGEGSVLRKA